MVEVTTLDDAIDKNIDVLKLDVEGHEHQVLQGAKRLLAAHQIRHIVFEDHGGISKPLVNQLASAGFELFRLGGNYDAPALDNVGTPSSGNFGDYNYLATIEPDEARAQFRRPGWTMFAS